MTKKQRKDCLKSMSVSFPSFIEGSDPEEFHGADGTVIVIQPKGDKWSATALGYPNGGELERIASAGGGMAVSIAQLRAKLKEVRDKAAQGGNEGLLQCHRAYNAFFNGINLRELSGSP